MNERCYRDREQAYDSFDPLIDHEWITYDFEGKKYRVYKNANVSIFLTDYCNACCKFCIEQVEYRSKRDMLVEKPHILNKIDYLKRLDYILNYIRPLNTSLSITGGEPTMSPCFTDVLRIIAKYNFRKITINSNGSGLMNIVDGKPIYQHIIDAGISNLNISRHHWNDTMVNKVMRFENTPCTTELLREVIPRCRQNNVRPRINCVIIKGYIDTIEDMVNFLEYYMRLGIDNVVFRQMMEYNPVYVKNEEIVKFYEERLMKIDELWIQMDLDDRFSKEKEIRGRYYYVEIWKYKNVDIVTERASSVVKNKDIGIDEEDMVYEMIAHPSGTLTKGWYYKKGVLLDYGK